MPLPDDLIPDPADFPETQEFLAPEEPALSETPPIAPLESEAVQASDFAEDQSFDSLSDVTAHEFDRKNPQPVGDSEIASIPDVAVPPTVPPKPVGEKRTTPLRDSTKSYKERREDFRSMQEVTQAEFRQKQGLPPTSTDTEVANDPEEFGNAINEYRSKAPPIGSINRDTSSPAEEVLTADIENRDQMAEMLSAHSRRIDQITRLLEMQRL